MNDGGREAAVHMQPNTGGVREGWFYEENQASSRLGIRVTEHLHGERSEYQKIDVYDSEFFGRFLTLDDLMMFTERDEFVYHEMLTHVPLCSLPAPERVLIVGGGDAGCAREILKHSTVRQVVQCDIDERVTRVCERWFPWLEAVFEDPRFEARFADGVEYIREHEDSFDLILIDSTDPIGPAVGLFQSEFFEAARRALREGGVLVNQTESVHWAPELVAAVVGQMREVFPEVSTYWGAIPTYPSGSWCWSYASGTRRPHDHFDEERARQVAASCRYWSPELQRAAFVLPRFLQQALSEAGGSQ
jgi:spermidine synthase